MDNEQPRQELVKCVVVGDTAVGKTRLICARACNSRLDLSQLMTTHIPTVWAIDQYRIHKEVLERSWEVIDGVNVSLRLWDTFGDHDKDRHFAYGRSDVVLLCFSVVNPISLRNCKVVWYPEIRRFCPNTPIVLVGCKNDLRYMYRDEKFLSLCRERSPFFRANHLCSRFPELGRPLKETDILTPEQGRMIAKELDAPYYESSVFTHYGVNEVFENVIRVALIARRQQRFWMTNLKHVQKSLLQEPFCPPKPLAPKINIPPSQFDKHMINLLQYQTFTDVILSVGRAGICAHKFILSAGSNQFYKLFTMDLTNTYEYYNSTSVMCRSNSDSSIASSTDVSVGNFNTDTEQLINNTSPSSTNGDRGHINKSYLLRASNNSPRKLPNLPSNIDYSNGNSNLRRRLSLNDETLTNFSYKSGVQKTLNHPLFQSISIEHGDNVIDFNGRIASFIQTVVALSNVTLETLQYIIKFIYCGSLETQKEFSPINELIDTAEILDMRELSRFIRNIFNNNPTDNYVNQRYLNEYHLKFKKSLKSICLEEGLFTDVIFQVDDGSCSAHKAILMSRCEMMDAMFRGYFVESSAKIISFPGVNKETFEHLLNYIYTDCIDLSINHTNCLPLLELANRLCLSRLVALIEHQVVTELNNLIDDGIDITEIALRLLEPCQLHNANQLADWCLYFISINYNDICHKNNKLLRSLHPENQAYLNRNRWPPVWYLKEYDYYERCVRERQWHENPPKGLKRHRYSSGCLCFSGKSRRNEPKYENKSI